MVYSLIKKDLILHKKAILVFLLMVLLYFPIMLSTINGRGIVTISFIYTIMLPLMIFIREYKFSGNVLFCSLPFKRKSIVLGTYLSAWIQIITGILFCLFTAAVMNIFLFGNHPEFWEDVTLRGILSGFLFLSVIILIWFPLNFQFGIGKGAVVGLLLLGILGFLAGSLFSTISPGFNPVFILRAFIHSFRSAMDTILITSGEAGLYALLITAIVLLNYLSFNISYRIFSRKDL